MARKPRNYTPIIPSPEPEPPALPPAELLADGVVDLQTAAKLCGHARTWIWEQVSEGKLPSFLVDGKRVIPRRAVIAFLAAQMQAAG